MKLSEVLNIGQREVISLVGGGGKTTLMFALARELALTGKHVVTTTTTKLLASEPLFHGSPLLILEREEYRLMELVTAGLTRFGYVTVASERLSEQGRLKGISPETVDKLAKLGRIPIIINEADGAAHRSLKAPNASEPLIPESTTLVIPIVGIDALGAPLCEEQVFRCDIVSRITGLALGEIVSADAIATLLTHPDGIAKGTLATARIIPFINKIDLNNGLAKGRLLAARILTKKHPQIERVVLGQVQADDPVAEVIAVPGQCASPLQSQSNRHYGLVNL